MGPFSWSYHIYIERRSAKTNHTCYVAKVDPDQYVHPRSFIRLCTVHQLIMEGGAQNSALRDPLVKPDLICMHTLNNYSEVNFLYHKTFYK